MGVGGKLKLLNGEGVDTGVVTVEFVLAGVAVKFDTGCNEGA